MDLAGTQWLVTGDTGFIGRRVCSLLRARRATVQGLSRKSGGDLRNPDTWLALVRNTPPQYVIHLASAGVATPASADELNWVNVLATDTLLRVLAGITPPVRVVLAGTGAEYGPQTRLLNESDEIAPISLYGQSKVEASRIAESYKDRLGLTWLRIFNVYGHGEYSNRLLPYLVRSALAGTPAMLSSESQIRDFSYVDDLAAALVSFATRAQPTHSWEICNVGSGMARPVTEFVAQVEATLKKRGLTLEVRFGGRPPAAHDSAYYAPDVRKMRQMLPRLSAPTLWSVGIERAVDDILRKYPE